MPYTAKITRTNPTCLLFLVDQSGSMRLPFGRDQRIRKADGVADAINRLLYGFVLKTTSGDHVLDRYFIGVFGYGKRVGSALGGDLAGQGLVPVSQIADKPLRLEKRVKKVSDGAGGLVEAETRFPVWLDPVANSSTTPMCEALREAKKTIESFVTSCPKAFPPIVINITDGAASDGDPRPLADELRQLSTEDGQVLLFNVHISSKELPPIEFPSREEGLPDKHARLLYRMSSTLPEQMIQSARSMELTVAEGARGFVFNADLVSVIQFLEIGTEIKNQ